MLEALFFSTLAIFFQFAPLTAECNYLKGFNAEVDFLLWKATCDDLSLIEIQGNSADAITVETATVRPYDYGWAPGFRLGLTYNDCCLWGMPFNLFCTYTRFRTTADVNFEAPLTDVEYLIIIRSGGNVLSFGGPTDAIYQSEADFLYNRVDFGFTTRLSSWAKLNLNASCGFTYLHFRQAITDQLLRGVLFDRRYILTSFSGYGPMISLDADYNIYQGISFYSGINVAGLLGPLNAHRHRETQVLESEVFSDTNKSRFVCLLDAGIAYKGCYKGIYPFELMIGWEFLYLPEAVSIPQINSSDQPTADIMLNALVISAGFDF